MASFKPMVRATTFAGDTSSTTSAREFSMLTRPSLRPHSFAGKIPLFFSSLKTLIIPPPTQIGITSLGLLRRRVARSNFVIESSASKPTAVAETPVDVTSLNKSKVVIIVDAFSTGACVAENAQNRGYAIAHAVSLASPADLGDMVPGHLKGGVLKWVAEVGLAQFVDINIASEELAYRLDGDLKAAGFTNGICDVVAVVAGTLLV